MKKNLRYFMTLLLMMVASVGWADEKESVNFSSLGYENQQAIESYAGTNFTVTFDKGTNSNAPKYYTTGTAIRVYGGNTFTVSSSDNTIIGITLTFSSGEGTNAITADNGTYSNNTWTGGAKSVTFTVAGTTGHRRIAGIEVTYKGGDPTAPSINAENVELKYDATSASISYEITNSVEGGVLTASSSESWLTVGTTTGSTIPLNCEANQTKIPRTATVTLTYTYNTNETVTKSVTVTQAANPNLVDNISDITAEGTYTVQGTIVAKSQRGFIVGDGTGYVYYYNQSYAQADYNIGDIVKLSGSVVAYGGVFEFNNSTTITTATKSNYVVEEPAVLTGSDMDTRVASSTPQLSSYVQYQGTLSVSGNYYNITNIEGANTAVGSISYPISTDDFASLNEKTVKVSGYYVGISSSKYYNTLIGSIEEVAGASPIITAEDVTLAYNETSGSITYSVANPVEGQSILATTDATWIDNINVGESEITFTTTVNQGTDDRTATITLSYNGAEDKVVTVTQRGYVADYATLPFEFDGGKGDIETTDGLTQEGLDSDYGSSPKLKFNSTGDELILKFNERPGTLTFDIKGNSFSGSTFKVQTSEDGSTYTDLETYTELGTQSESFNNLGENVRFIKWIYTEKVSGNVALGNISLAKYVAPQNYTLTIPSIDNVTITASYGTDQLIEEGESEEIVQGTEITLTVDAAEGYTFDNLAVTDGGENSFTPSPVSGSEGAYRFTMPSYNATISLDVTEYVAPVTATYKLATSITSGKHYVIASGKKDGSVQVMGEQKSNNRGAVEAKITDGVLEVSEGNDFVIESVTDGYTIFDADVPGYLYAAASDKNYLKTQAEIDVNGIWTITFDASSGAASIKAEGSENRNVMQYNSSSTLFACYASASQGPVYLFEKVVPIKTAASGYTTLVSGEALDIAELPEGLTAYYVTADGVSTEKVTLTQVTAAVPAETPLIFKGAGSTDYYIHIATGETTPLEGNQLAGHSNQSTELTANSAYILSGGEFHPTLAGTFPAGKAYLAVAVPTTGEAKNLTIVFGEGTGINNVNVNENESGKIFNLAGQQMKSAVKGVYIKNGRKYVK